MEKTIDIMFNDLRKEIAKEILVMDCPTLSGQYNDPWQMFLYVRNKAVEIASNGKDLFEDELNGIWDD